jgi:hypothetical protein
MPERHNRTHLPPPSAEEARREDPAPCGSHGVAAWPDLSEHSAIRAASASGGGGSPSRGANVPAS